LPLGKIEVIGCDDDFSVAWTRGLSVHVDAVYWPSINLGRG
jgi:hypothetical protein